MQTDRFGWLRSLAYLSLLLLGLCLGAHAQNTRVDGVVYRSSGFPAPGASISVCTQPATIGTSVAPCTPLAPLCLSATSSCSGGQPGGGDAPNPATSDGLGNYHFYIRPGKYSYQYYGSGLTTILNTDQTIPAALDTNNVFTGSNQFKYLENVRYADGFTGADCGAKVNAADADLSTTEGEIDVNQACGTTWSTAVQLSTNHVLRFIQCGTYNVNTINLAALGNNSILAPPSKCVILRPLNGSQTSIIAGTGASIAAPMRFVYITGLQIFENFTPGTNADGIVINYANSFWLDHLTVNGFYDNFTYNNSTYVDHYKIRSNGATHRNLYMQWTDTSHGPIFGTNFSSIDSEYDSATGTSDYSVFITDYAGIWFVDNDVTGNGGGGMTLLSINSASDQPAGNMIVGNFFDANANSGFVANKQRDCNIQGNWFSSGRTGGNDNFTITNSWGCKITSNVAFWGGAHGFNFNGANANFTISGNVGNANTSSNYRFIGLTNSTLTGNASLAHIINSQGVLSSVGFNEDGTSSGNVWAGNTSTDATTPWSLAGTSDLRFEDQMITGTQRAGPSGVANTGFLWYSNADNRWRINVNNGASGGEQPLVGTATTDTLSNKSTAAGPLAGVVASGTSTLTANAALGAVTSQAAITTGAIGALTTDAIEWTYATAPGAGDSLCHVSAYVTAGNVNFVRSNPTAAAQNVTAIVINWRVVR